MAEGVHLCVGGEKTQFWFALSLRGQETVTRKHRPGVYEKSQAWTPAQEVEALGMEGLPEGGRREQDALRSKDPQGAPPCQTQEQQQDQGEAGQQSGEWGMALGPTGRGAGMCQVLQRG